MREGNPIQSHLKRWLHREQKVMAGIQAEPTRSERLRVNINSDTISQLEEMMRTDGISATEVTRRAIGVYHFLWQLTRRGKRVFYGSNSSLIEVEIKMLH